MSGKKAKNIMYISTPSGKSFIVLSYNAKLEQRRAIAMNFRKIKVVLRATVRTKPARF